MSDILKVNLSPEHISAFKRFTDTDSNKRVYTIEDYDWIKLVWEYAMKNDKVPEGYKLKITKILSAIIDQKEINVPDIDLHLDRWDVNTEL